MDKVIFYYQERQDGGTRTGLEGNDASLLESFQAGSDERDPLIVWYVEVECHGEFGDLAALGAGREWLYRYGGGVRKALQSAANRLGAGLDVELEPWKWDVPDMSETISATVVVSATRRLAALEVAKKLRTLDMDWDRLIQRLQDSDAVQQV